MAEYRETRYQPAGFRTEVTYPSAATVREPLFGAKHLRKVFKLNSEYKRDKRIAIAGRMSGSQSGIKVNETSN